MSKRSQLDEIRALRLPTPRFTALSWQDYQGKERISTKGMKFPVAVRSTFEEEDGSENSMAGHFETCLNVSQESLADAVSQVFNSYPKQEGQEVIIQEMLDPIYSGVLFAYRDGIWKLEMTEGLGEQIVGGKVKPISILLPRFTRIDRFFSRFISFWKASPALNQKTIRSLITLSNYTHRLLNKFSDAKHGLDIEFSITDQGLFLLQARPITTPGEEEQVLTSANHKEILPPQPSPLMTSIISSAGSDLFAFYRSLDVSLPKRSFLVSAAGMPWINLSALLDTMIHWGLPTSLVARSVGAVDFYKVGFRPWRFLSKLPVFFRLFKKQLGVAAKVRDWVKKQRVVQRISRTERELLWASDPHAAAQSWINDFRTFYIDLVSYMQLLTGAMSGPVSIATKLGQLNRQQMAGMPSSASTDYLKAFQDLQQGQIDKASFLRRFGHRGFYESDIGQARFWEYQEEDWHQLLGDLPYSIEDTKRPQKRKKKSKGSLLLRPLIQLIHTREWIRHMSMQFFWQFRQELQDQSNRYLDAKNTCWNYTFQDLLSLMSGQKSVLDIPDYPIPSGWDLNTFLANQLDRRIPIQDSFVGEESGTRGIGVYPGKVKGQVWLVGSADFSNLKPPEYERIILVADALDPGWIPFFSAVDGVLSKVGGLLSHASIILREAGIPSITQIPSNLNLKEGDWIEMDGKTGEVQKVGISITQDTDEVDV